MDNAWIEHSPAIVAAANTVGLHASKRLRAHRATKMAEQKEAGPRLASCCSAAPGNVEVLIPPIARAASIESLEPMVLETDITS